jgi:hypothetical protein
MCFKCTFLWGIEWAVELIANSESGFGRGSLLQDIVQQSPGAPGKEREKKKENI